MRARAGLRQQGLGPVARLFRNGDRGCPALLPLPLLERRLPPDAPFSPIHLLAMLWIPL